MWARKTQIESCCISFIFYICSCISIWFTVHLHALSSSDFLSFYNSRAICSNMQTISSFFSPWVVHHKPFTKSFSNPHSKTTHLYFRAFIRHFCPKRLTFIHLFGVQYLAQGHFNILTRGIIPVPSEDRTLSLLPEPHLLYTWNSHCSWEKEREGKGRTWIISFIPIKFNWCTLLYLRQTATFLPSKTIFLNWRYFYTLHL